MWRPAADTPKCDHLPQTLRNVTTSSRHSEMWLPAAGTPKFLPVQAPLLSMQVYKHFTYRSAAWRRHINQQLSYQSIRLHGITSPETLYRWSRSSCRERPVTRYPRQECARRVMRLYICFSIKAQASCHESQTQFHPLGHRLSSLAGRDVGPLSHRSVRRAISHTASVKRQQAAHALPSGGRPQHDSQPHDTYSTAFRTNSLH